MNRPLLVWSPGPDSTRVMVICEDEILLKAQLSPRPSHPRAAQWLMEAIALWEGAPVRAVISVDAAHASSANHFWDAVGMDLGGALYSLRQAACEPRQARQLSFLRDLVPDMEGMDGMDDLADILVREALHGVGA